jgi:glycosyltransferase involved in cell wall biosynthesis
MNILFIHQNFPGQFKHIAPELARDPANRVVAFTMRKDIPSQWEGVNVISYSVDDIPKPKAISWLSDFEVKSIRAEACFRASSQLAASGFNPDIIIAHPAWGESLFIKELWPNAKLAIYCEFFYRSKGLDVGFDPEFEGIQPADLHRFSFKNINNLLHMQIADAAISPTQWQASTFPSEFQKKITVIHDGIDTSIVRPDAEAKIALSNQVTLSKEDEVITYVSRELEPYRGYHQLMRSLPDLLKMRPKARVLIVGGDGVSYGQRPTHGKTWAETFAREVRPFVSDSDWSRVHFLGKIPYQHYLKVLQISSVHIYMTYPFVLSWSLLEAMSVGCAIVASDTGPVQELIGHGKTGLLCNFFDKNQLVRSVTQILEDQKLANTLGLKARETIIESYDLRTVSVPKQLEWINHITNNGKH